MENLTPTSQLEAINQMLSAIGESPVNTVAGSGNVDAAVALSTLHNVSREVQKNGWHWNTDLSLKLSPDTEGNLTLPENTLKVDSVGPDEDVDVVQRGRRLYDRVNHTYTFARALTLDIVLFLPFEELPETARHYIAMRAVRRFQQNTVGSDQLSAFNANDELRALVDLQNAEAETADLTVLGGSSAVGRVLAR